MNISSASPQIVVRGERPFDQAHHNSANWPPSVANSANMHIRSQNTISLDRDQMLANSTNGLVRERTQINQQTRNNQINSGGLEIITEEIAQNRIKRRISTEQIKEGRRRKSLERKQREQPKKTCRICLCEQDEKAAMSDPIISVCHCKGSSGDMHLKCLQVWLNQKRKVNELSNFQYNYIYKKS